MLLKYIQEALRKARYEIIEDKKVLLRGGPRVVWSLSSRKEFGRMSGELERSHRRLADGAVPRKPSCDGIFEA